VFVFATKFQVREILNDDINKMAGYVAQLLENEYEAKRIQAHQLAQDNALRVVLDLNLPAQGRKILVQLKGEGHYNHLWLLDAGGAVVAASDAEEKIFFPPVGTDAVNGVLIKWEGQLFVLFVNPIKHHSEVLGYLAVMTSFPGQYVFNLIDHEKDIGLALWLNDGLVAMSGWLKQTGFVQKGYFDRRGVISFELGGTSHEFMSVAFSMPSIGRSAEFNGELVRNLEKAEKPFVFVNLLFYISLVFILVVMAVFSRYIAARVIKPILSLAKNADSIKGKGYAVEAPKITLEEAEKNEVAALYRSFYEMVQSQHEAIAKAEQAEQVKSEFLSVVSHELRTPMTSVIGFTKMNQKRLRDNVYPHLAGDNKRAVKAISQVEKNFEIIISEGERLTFLINDILDLAKLESGSFEWEMKPVDIEDLLRQSFAACTSLFINKNLDYQLDVPPGLPEVQGNFDKLMQVVINLLSNAIKFTNQGEIICSAQEREGLVVVSIRDTGIGIPEGEQNLVFERFHQQRETLTGKPQGTGLGLPICKNIIEAHGGNIWFESRPGHGSTFSFSLSGCPGAAAQGNPA